MRVMRSQRFRTHRDRARHGRRKKSIIVGESFTARTPPKKGAEMWCKKILLAYDGSPAAKVALELAMDEAQRDESIEIVAAHVLSINATVGAQEVLIRQAEDIHDELEGVLARIPNPTKVEVLRGTSPADLLLSCAKREGCNLIIMGSRGVGGAKGYLGSVSYAVVQRSTEAAVLIAKEGMRF